MTLHFRLKLIAYYIWSFFINGTPIYYRSENDNDTYIRIARWRYDPWTDVKTLVTSHHGVERELNLNGTVGKFDSVKWMYVNKSRRTMQKLRHSDLAE